MARWPNWPRKVNLSLIQTMVNNKYFVIDFDSTFTRVEALACWVKYP